MIDSVFRMFKNYYAQLFLEECKHTVKKIIMLRYITDSVELSSGDEYSEEEKNSDEKNYSEE